MRSVLCFLKVNIVLFIILNAVSYIAAAMIADSFFVPLQRFLFPHIFSEFGLGPLSVFGLILWYLWLYLCFWGDGEITDELGAAFFEFFIFIVAAVSTILVFLGEYSIILSLRDIWIGFWLASLINASAGASYCEHAKQS